MPYGHPEPELVHAGNLQVFVGPPGTGEPVVRRGALVGSEQRRLVAADQTVEDVAVLDVERGDRVGVAIPDRDIARRIGQRGRIDGGELGHPRRDERPAPGRHELLALVLVDVAELGGVGHRAEGPDRGQGRPGIVGAPRGRLPENGPVGRGAGRRQEAERGDVREVVLFLIEVVIAFGDEPVEDPPPQLAGAGEPAAIVFPIAVVQLIERIGGVREPIGNERPVRAPVRVLGEEVDARLHERDREERSAGTLGRVLVVRAPVERAEREIDARGELLIDVDPEVLSGEALDAEDHALGAGVLERGVEVGLAPALAHRRIVGEEQARLEHLGLVVVILRIGVIGDVVRLADPRATGIPLEADVARIVGVGLHLEGVGVRVRDPLGHERGAGLVARGHEQLAVGEVGASLGEDLDHPVGRVGAVERGRGGALDDLHPLDVLGGDVGEAEPGDGAVDDDEGILIPGDAGRAAEPDGRRRARLTAGLDQPHAGHLALERPERRDPRGLLQLIGGHLADREGQLLGGGRLRDAGHHQLVQPKRIVLELEVDGLGAGRQGDGLAARRLAEVPGQERGPLALHAIRRYDDGVIAIWIGGRADGRALEQHTRPTQGPALIVRHLAGDGRVLSRSRVGSEQEQRRDAPGPQESRDCRTPHHTFLGLE